MNLIQKEKLILLLEKYLRSSEMLCKSCQFLCTDSKGGQNGIAKDQVPVATLSAEHMIRINHSERKHFSGRKNFPGVL